MDQGTCERCGTTTGVKKDGDLWKHRTPDGVQCETGPVHHTVEAVPMTLSAEALTKKSGGKRGGLSIDVAGVDTPQREKKPATPPKKPKNVFAFTLTVDVSCPYIGDTSWETSNKMLAFKKAKDAGQRPNGEPVLASIETVGDKKVLRYEVPVE